ncbi:glycosyltransferase [Mariniflexile aquimaris]|uniref:Glycosyltransferase n=1 Tax=Mariniflexile aquimaris TaxID=881009 RepID=A0ABW3BUV1_9FLAO
MKIIYYTDQIYLHGGLERVLANKLNYFSNNTDFELHVITFQQKNNPPCYTLPKNVQLHDLDIDYNRTISFLNPLNLKLSLQHYLRLKRKIKFIQPDIIVICNYEFGFYFIPLIAKNVIKIKEFHSSKHFSYIEQSKNRNILKTIKYKLADYFESKYDYLVLLTTDELKYYKGKNKLVIPNAITKTNSNGANLINKKAISAGRIAPVKGFEYLINSWKHVVDECPDWTLNIYGEGEEDYVKKLQNQINSLNLGNHVFLNGSTNDLESKMLDSSIYAMTSLTECFPMVLLEAMSCGLPIVSFDSPNGPRNIITNNEDGVIVEYLNEKLLAVEMINLIKDIDKRKIMGQNGRNNILKFSELNVMSKWLELFNSRLYNKKT